MGMKRLSILGMATGFYSKDSKTRRRLYDSQPKGNDTEIRREMKYRIDWAIIVVLFPLTVSVLGIRLAITSDLVTGLISAVGGLAMVILFVKVHRDGQLANYINMPAREKIPLFSMFAITVGLLAAEPTLLRLFRKGEEARVYFLNLSTGGKIAVGAGYVLAIILLILWARFISKRRDAKELLKKEQQIKEQTNKPAKGE
jgi:hypothetical protein